MKLTIRHTHVHHHYAPTVGQDEIITYFKKIEMKQTELAAQLADLKTTLLKSKAEVQAKLAELGTAIENQDNVSAEVQSAFAEVKTAVGDMDNLIPDTSPTEPPVEEEGTGEGEGSL